MIPAIWGQKQKRVNGRTNTANASENPGNGSIKQAQSLLLPVFRREQWPSGH
jgi:hypothetical protein